MFCVVYRLYRDAVRLPPDEAKADGQGGWLLVTHRGKKSPQHILVARLYRSPSDTLNSILPELWHPTLCLVKEGLLISGLEEAGYQVKQHQRWWCVPGVLDDLALQGYDDKYGKRRP